MKNDSRDIRERTFEFALKTLRTCKKIRSEEKEFILTNQLSRSATSVGANVREARNAVSKADFVNKLAIAQKECDESIYWIELLIAFLDRETDELLQLSTEADELLRIISTIILKTKTNGSWIKR